MPFFKKKPSLQTEQDFLMAINDHQMTLEQAKEKRKINGMGTSMGSVLSLGGTASALLAVAAGATGLISTVAAAAFFPVLAGVGLGGAMLVIATTTMDWFKKREINNTNQEINKTVSQAVRQKIQLPSLDKIGSRLDQLFSETQAQAKNEGPNTSRNAFAR